MSELKVIGAGGGGPRKPRIEDETMRSGATARVVELLCEGPIEGFATPAQPERSIFLEGTPVMNPDGTKNFAGFEYTFHNGTPDQPPLEGFDMTESYVSVGAQLICRSPSAVVGSQAPIPVVRQIDNVEVSHVVVIINIAEMYHAYENGDVKANDWALSIETRTDTTGWGEVFRIDRNDKITSQVQKSFRIELPAAPTTGLTYRQVRVTKTWGADSGQNGTHRFGGNIYWDGYVEQISTQLRYPNTAVVGFKVKAEQFSSVPTRKYLMKLLKVRVPDGYDPVTRTYPTIWNGSFSNVAVWSDNPAWCLRDLLLSKRYGLGEYLDVSQVDDYELYRIGKYCDELVPNGAGGFEPRFTLNCMFNDRDQALDVVRDIVSVFRGMGLWDGTRFSVVQDRPGPVVMQYTPANVVDGVFNYQGSSIKNRHSVAVVAWANPDQSYKTDYEYVEDVDAMRRYGVRKLELTAFGCTSRTQAQRVGRWALYSELYETEIVSFAVGLDSMLVRPGDVVQISDPTRLASPTNAGDESDRMGGRLVSGTTTDLVLDSPVTLLSGETYHLSVILPDGSLEERQCFVQGTSTSSGGTGNTITLLSPLSAVPVVGAIWLIYRTTLVPFIARVLSVNAESNGTYKLTAHKHYPDKYGMVEQGLRIDQPNNTSLPDPGYCPPPVNVQATEVIYTTTTGLSLANLSVSWQAPATGLISGYDVAYRGGQQGNWITLPRISGYTVDIERIEPGDYDVKVTAINFAGKASVPIIVSTTATGKTAPPKDLLSFTATGGVMQIHLRWAYAAEYDIRLVELWAGPSPDQNLAIKLTDLAFPQDSYTHLGLGLNVHMHYWMRAKDTSGHFSGWTSADAVTSSDPTEYVNLMQDAVNRSMLVRDLLQDIDNPALALLDLSGRVSWMSDMLRDLKTKSDAVIEVDPDNGAIRLKTMAKVDSLAAAVRQEIKSRVDGDLVLSQIVTDIGSTNDDVSAAIHEESVARVQGQQALASQLTTLGVQTANLSAAVSVLSEAGIDASTGQARAVYEVRVQTLSNGNKVIAGFGLASEATGSEFVVMADKFHVVAPGSTTARQLFSIDSSGGTPVAVLNGDFVTLGTISAGALVSADMTVKSGGFIESDNYDATHGWHLSDTEAILNNCTIRGNLSGATGTFGGSLTATAINAVDTINIAGNAVTIPVVSALASQVTVAANGADTWEAATPVLSATFNNNSSNSVTLVTHWSVQTDITSGGDYLSKQYVVLDGVVSFGRHVAGIGNNSPDNSTGQFNFVTVNPGVHTIELRVQLFGDINSGPSVIAGRMFVMGAKK